MQSKKSLVRIKGTVIHGAGRGRKLGFPTANLDTSPEQLPETGVYAVWVRRKNREEWLKGAASVGYNLTFGHEKDHVEVYILDFNEWIYGEELEVVFVYRLRGEVEFDGKDDLIAQMEKDCIETRRLLTEEKKPGNTENRDN